MRPSILIDLITKPVAAQRHRTHAHKAIAPVFSSTTWAALRDQSNQTHHMQISSPSSLTPIWKMCARVNHLLSIRLAARARADGSHQPEIGKADSAPPNPTGVTDQLPVTTAPKAEGSGLRANPRINPRTFRLRSHRSVRQPTHLDTPRIAGDEHHSWPTPRPSPPHTMAGTTNRNKQRRARADRRARNQTKNQTQSASFPKNQRAIARAGRRTTASLRSRSREGVRTWRRGGGRRRRDPIGGWREGKGKRGRRSRWPAEKRREGWRGLIKEAGRYDCSLPLCLSVSLSLSGWDGRGEEMRMNGTG